MGAALNTASASNAYVLSDRGTWLVVQEPRRPRDLGRGRQKAFQPVRRHTGKSRKAPTRKKGARPSLHRLAGFAGGTEGHRRLQDQRRAIVLSECRRHERVMRGVATIHRDIVREDRS